MLRSGFAEPSRGIPGAVNGVNAVKVVDDHRQPRFAVGEATALGDYGVEEKHLARVSQLKLPEYVGRGSRARLELVLYHAIADNARNEVLRQLTICDVEWERGTQ